MTGFSITCLRCGATMSIQPGVRDQDREPIGFGFDQIRESTLIHCRKCRNGLESEDRWEDGKEPDEVKLVEYWIDASGRLADESAVYGNDCPGGKCEM